MQASPYQMEHNYVNPKTKDLNRKLVLNKGMQLYNLYWKQKLCDTWCQLLLTLQASGKSTMTTWQHTRICLQYISIPPATLSLQYQYLQQGSVCNVNTPRKDQCAISMPPARISVQYENLQQGSACNMNTSSKDQRAISIPPVVPGGWGDCVDPVQRWAHD